LYYACKSIKYSSNVLTLDGKIGEKMTNDSEFRETTGKNTLNKDQQELLSRKISDLSLMIKGTWLESLVNQLYRELRENGISFQPRTYLADEWG
jgi:hypothetical protein